MSKLLAFVSLCIALYSLISRNRRYALTQRAEEAAIIEKHNETNRIVSEYRQIADSLDSDFVLHIKGADIQHVNLIIPEGFICLSDKGLALCELKKPESKLVIPYDRFKHFRYVCDDWPTSTDDPIKIIQGLIILKFNLKPKESEYIGSLTSVYFDRENDSPGMAFNIDSLNNYGNFFEALEKRINKYGSSTIEKAIESSQ